MKFNHCPHNGCNPLGRTLSDGWISIGGGLCVCVCVAEKSKPIEPATQPKAAGDHRCCRNSGGGRSSSNSTRLCAASMRVVHLPTRVSCSSTSISGTDGPELLAQRLFNGRTPGGKPAGLPPAGPQVNLSTKRSLPAGAAAGGTHRRSAAAESEHRTAAAAAVAGTRTTRRRWEAKRDVRPVT